MRRTATMIVAGALSLLLAACGGGANTTTQEEPAQTEEATDAAATEEEDAKDKKDATSEKKFDAKAVATTIANGELDPEKQEGESLLISFIKTLDWEKGVHMVYAHTDDHEEYGTDSVVEVYVKGESYFGSEDYTLPSYNISGTKATAVVDGVMYSVDTESHEATSVMDALDDQLVNPLRNDYLYSAVLLTEAMHASDNYTTEEREYEGKTYTAEVYPSPNEYIPTTTFLFDDDGNLVYCLREALDTANVGNAVFTIQTIDSNVDDSLLSLSGYTIKELGE